MEFNLLHGYYYFMPDPFKLPEDTIRAYSPLRGDYSLDVPGWESFPRDPLGKVLTLVGQLGQGHPGIQQGVGKPRGRPLGAVSNWDAVVKWMLDPQRHAKVFESYMSSPRGQAIQTEGKRVTEQGKWGQYLSQFGPLPEKSGYISPHPSDYMRDFPEDWMQLMLRWEEAKNLANRALLKENTRLKWLENQVTTEKARRFFPEPSEIRQEIIKVAPKKVPPKPESKAIGSPEYMGKIAGAEYKGTTKIGGKDRHWFHDPVTGTTGVISGGLTPERIMKWMADNAKKFGK